MTHRVSTKPIQTKFTEAINYDQHLELNLLGKNKGIMVTNKSDRKQICIWKLRFTPQLNKTESIFFRIFARKRSHHKGSSVLASEITHERHSSKELPVPFFDTWKHLLWRLRFDQIVLTVIATFALLPSCNIFSIVIKDTIITNSHIKGKSAEVGEIAIETFSRYSLGYHMGQLLAVKRLSKYNRHKK